MSRQRTRGAWGSALPPTFLGSSSGSPFTYYYRQPNFESCFDALHRGPPYRTGGGFTLLKTWYVTKPSAEVSLTGIGSPRRFYKGRFIGSTFGSNPLSGTKPSLPSFTQAAEHAAMGAKGWDKFKPGKPVAGLGQALVELRQIPTIPSLLTALRTFRGLGSQYLNVEFGWKPFLKDLYDILYSTEKLAKALHQLKKDNGQWVRRRGTVAGDTDTSLVSTSLEGGYPVLTNEFYVNATSPGSRTRSIVTTERHWFSAAFRYYIPDILTPPGELRASIKLLGANPTPALVWELLPWSWLADWFTNIGSVLDNISGNAAENLAAKYAYIMSEYTTEDRYESTLTVKSVFPTTVTYDLSMTSSRFQAVKLRSAANPFGFGLTFASLSVRQMLILSALGLARHG